MDERSRRRIREHLQREDTQERIQRYIEKGRAEATVTISRASELFGLSENRLRDWEEHGLLSPLRPTGPKGRRLYTPGELDKLAIIRELIDAGYAPSDIPPDIDIVWHTISASSAQALLSERNAQLTSRASVVNHMNSLPINQRIDVARHDLFWRYFVARVLRLSLMIICEELPHTSACLLLPLEPKLPVDKIHRVEEVSSLGESLLGWLNQSRSSHTLLTALPTFEYASDYRLLPLTTMTEDRSEEPPQDNTLILLDRRSRLLTLTAPMVETIRTLLRPLYEEVRRSRVCFGPGMRDVLDPATDPESIIRGEDVLLNGLTEMVVRLGGKDSNGQSRWHYCCIFLPNYPTSILSLQQRALIVRAQSEHSPYKVAVTTLHPQGPAIDACVRAFQSGHIVSLPVIPPSDTHLVRNEDLSRRSAMAVPVEGPDGMPIAVLYVASEATHAFSVQDQRLLRIIGDMVSELLETYNARLRPIGKLREIITAPSAVDPLFRDFLTENEFAEHVEAILDEARRKQEYQPKDVVSFIALDIDNQSSLANKFGDRMARDLSKAVGLRALGQLRALKEDGDCELYHINADRFYIVLQGIPMAVARSKAEQIRRALAGSYQIDPQRAPIGQPTLPENMVTLSNITVRLAVSSYPYAKLLEILRRETTEYAVVKSRNLMMRFLDEVLDMGKREGGNVVMSWDPDSRNVIHFSPLP